MAAGEKVAFQPALALMFAKHLHHPSVGRDMVVRRNDLSGGVPICNLEHVAPTVGRRLVRAEDAEVLGGQVPLQHVPNETALDASGLGHDGARFRNVNSVLPEVRHRQRLQEEAAVGVRVGPHTPLTGGRQLRQFWDQLPGLVKKLLRLVALHPLFEQLDVAGLLGHFG